MTAAPAATSGPPRGRAAAVRRSSGALRPARPGAAVVDGAAAVAFLAAMAAERLGAATELRVGPVPALALSLLLAGALAVRRRAPLAAYLAGTAALSAEALFVLPSPVSPYANLVGLYSLGLYATRGRALLGPVVVLPGMAAYFAGLAHTYPALPAGVLFVWLLAWAVGFATARRQEEREAARLLLRRRVVGDERARIARELHDLVGHTLNVMLVQAGAARRVLTRDPEQTRELLTGLEHTGREALDELDRVLGLLRRQAPLPDVGAGPGPGAVPVPAPVDAPAPAPGPGPRPGLADLPRLTGRAGQAGLRVTVRLDPAARDLPRTLDRSAYRIVQEALTNTVKHGRTGADPVDVTVTIAVRTPARVLDLLVLDHGCGAPGGYTPGRGLLGIAERVAMFGGSLEHGGGDGGGFRLRVTLPLG
ncbi:histidine kinase [Kitasatospora sp. NBC_00240]|uniref:sensor histidine kinase n=1 Tax=Kitasatospora sp. NBC_00240 TaxID=2903567 RepID=UPI00225A9542|nr:histidine kinase [Kitasatospora sp. NBC_00240]MCX5215101.1 histidine kinase [Kitasatospora sp. NBC_00240]